MIEQKLIVGRYLELNTPPPALAGPAVNGFQEVNPIVLHIDKSESSSAPVTPPNPIHGFNPTVMQQAQIGLQRTGEQIKAQFDRQKVSSTGLGAVAKAHRNFVWLEWIGGVVSCIQPHGIDVLTGPMSGCWIVSFLQGGAHYIGHVGTVMTATDANTIAARAAWNNFAGANPRISYSGFNPFNDPWVGAVPAAQAGEAARKTFALVSTAGTFYTVITYPQINKPNRIRIAGIQQNTDSLPPNGLI